MQQALLDTNFILTCIKQKIDFFEDLQFRGIQILIPEQVINELKKLSSKKGTASSISEFALKFLRPNTFKTVDLKNNHVDEAIMDFAKENPAVIIATLDKDLKFKVNNPYLVIRGRKKLQII